MNASNNFTYLRKNKLIFVLGRIASVFGTEIYNFVFALMVLFETGSALTFAIVLILEVLPKIFLSTIAGILADRYDRKKIIVTCDVFSGSILLISYLIFQIQGYNLTMIYLLTLLLNVITTVFDVSMNASLDMLFEKDHFQQMCSINDGISSIVTIVAPTIGAFIYAVADFKIFLLINGISFLLSALLETGFVFKKKANQSFVRSSVKAEMKASIDFIKQERIVLDLYIAAIFINVFYNISVALAFPIILTKSLHFTEVQYGMMETTLAIGMIAAAIFLSMKKSTKSYRTIMLSLMGEAVSISLLALPMFVKGDWNWFLIYAVIIIVLGFSVTCLNVSVRVLMQRIIPSAIKGKVLGTLSTICLSIGPLFTIMSAAYIDHNDPFILILIAGGGFLLLNIFLMRNQRLKLV